MKLHICVVFLLFAFNVLSGEIMQEKKASDIANEVSKGIFQISEYLKKSQYQDAIKSINYLRNIHSANQKALELSGYDSVSMLISSLSYLECLALFQQEESIDILPKIELQIADDFKSRLALSPLQTDIGLYEGIFKISVMLIDKYKPKESQYQNIQRFFDLNLMRSNTFSFYVGRYRSCFIDENGENGTDDSEFTTLYCATTSYDGQWAIFATKIPAAKYHNLRIVNNGKKEVSVLLESRITLPGNIEGIHRITLVPPWTGVGPLEVISKEKL